MGYNYESLSSAGYSVYEGLRRLLPNITLERVDTRVTETSCWSECEQYPINPLWYPEWIIPLSISLSTVALHSRLFPISLVHAHKANSQAVVGSSILYDYTQTECNLSRCLYISSMAMYPLRYQFQGAWLAVSWCDTKTSAVICIDACLHRLIRFRWCEHWTAWYQGGTQQK